MGIRSAFLKVVTPRTHDSPEAPPENVGYTKSVDARTGVEVNADFERFAHRDDMFSRAFWDKEVRTATTLEFSESFFMPTARARKVDGFSQRDYAFRNASWHITNVFRDIEKCGSYRENKAPEYRREGYSDIYTTHDEGWPEPYAYENPEDAIRDVRRVAKYLGIGKLGVCAYDERWVYDSIFVRATAKDKAPEIPQDLPYVIATVEPMDQGLIGTGPSALSGTATGLGYSYDTVSIVTLAQFIRNMGYRAYASLNDSAISIPLGLQAGLGEVGRNGLLISEEYGPRFRIGKIFTDMPLTVDEPKSIGVTQFCDICDRCAKACPPKAIPFDVPSTKVHSRSNIKGVKKWTPIAEKCFNFWVNQNTDCSICIRVCPYNRDYAKLRNRIWIKLAKSPFRRLALLLDDWFMDRGRTKSEHWWRSTNAPS